jgi:Type VI immunity for VRR-NUC
MLVLPSQLATPAIVDAQVASKVMLDLTVYLVGPSELELEYLIDFYETICPADCRTKYTIAEFNYWDDIVHPDLTLSGQTAAAAGVPRPYLEPVRRRLRDGRAFEVGFWDGREIDDLQGSWSFRCYRVHLRETGMHTYMRIVIPLHSNYGILRTLALALSDAVEFYSGHGGLVFVYDPWLKEGAFDAIYAQARRFWGVDVEDMSDTLPLMKEGIKGVNWITLLGPRLVSEDSAAEIEAALGDLANTPDVTFEQRRHGSVLIAGPEPMVGDQHRPDHSLDPYYAVANALRSLFIADHPDFPSERWVENGNTVGWIRRFIDPAGWR